MRNRRSTLRFSHSLSLEIFTGQDVIAAMAMNLSSGGVGVNMNRPLTKGDTVGMSLFLVEEGIEDETSPTLNIKGTVVWSKEREGGAGFSAGIRFLTLTLDDKHKLQHFLDQLSGQAH